MKKMAEYAHMSEEQKRAKIKKMMRISKRLFANAITISNPAKE